MRLIVTELIRLCGRRAVVILIAAAFVVPLLIGVVTVWDSRPNSAGEVASARAKAVVQPGFDRTMRRCEKHPRAWRVASADQCEKLVVHRRTGVYREPLNLRHQLTGSSIYSSIAVAGLVLILTVLIGATSAGADWASGSMRSQVLLEPRRLRLWSAKALAVALLAGLLTSVVLMLYWLALGGVAALRDIPVPAQVLPEIAWMILRCSVLAMVCSVGGFALTMLSRSTGFTLGAMGAIAVAPVFQSSALPLGLGSARWYASTNLLAVLQGQATYWQAACPAVAGEKRSGAMAQLCNDSASLSVWDGLLFVLVPVIIIVALSMWSFRRRDVAGAAAPLTRRGELGGPSPRRTVAG